MKKIILSEEFKRMQKLAGIITEGQYKAKLNENSDKIKYLEDALRNVWNMGKDNNPIDFNKLAKSIDDDMFTILNNALEKYTSEMDDSEVW